MSDERSQQQHPEADVLAGFAESSLSQHERESVLSHLAACARCRQMVFLAHQVEPTHDTQTSNLKARPFWLRNWFPLTASATAAVALAVVTFSWYGQFHKQTTPQGREVAQQRPAPMPTGNEKAFEATEVAPPPTPATAAVQDGKSAAKRVRPDSKPQQAVTSPSPSAAFNSVRGTDEETRRLTEEEARQAAAGHDRMELGLNSATQKAQATGVVDSAAGSNAGTGDISGYSARAIQPGKVSRQAWDAPPSSGAVISSQPYREGRPAPAPESTESKQVHAEGCVEQGVETGCLMVKDRQSGKLYHVLIKGLRPQPGSGIEFTGVPHDGPTSCMQGTPLDVISWVDKSSLECAQDGAPKK